MSSIDLGDQRVPIGAKPQFSSDDNWGKGALLRTEEAKRAAAVATGTILADFAATSSSSDQVANANRIMSELAEGLTGTPTAPVVVVASAAEPVAQPEPVAEPATLDYELPPDVAALLDEPDEPVFDDAAPQPEPVAAETENDDAFADPEIAKLRKQVQAAEKRAEYERSLRVQTARKGWEAEAERVFTIAGKPLLTPEELAGISADSHKEFLRQAKAKADANKAIAQRFVGQPTLEPRPPVQDPAVWGKPTVGDPTADADSVHQARRLQAARRTGRLSEVLKAHIFPDQ